MGAALNSLIGRLGDIALLLITDAIVEVVLSVRTEYAIKGSSLSMQGFNSLSRVLGSSLVVVVFTDLIELSVRSEVLSVRVE